MNERIGIQLVFDAKTGEIKGVVGDVKKLAGAVERAGEKMERAGGKAAGFFRRFRAAHGRALKHLQYFLGAAGLGGLAVAAQKAATHVVRMGLAVERWGAKLGAARGFADLLDKGVAAEPVAQCWFVVVQACPLLPSSAFHALWRENLLTS